MDTETITLTLPTETVRAIREKVESGGYASADEVVEDALRLLDEEMIETPDFAAYMRAKIKESLDDPRPSAPIAEVFERLERRHEERLKAGRDEI